MKIVTVIGARPQFIKAAALSKEILKHPDISEIIIHTGQHFDANMSNIFFEEMGIPKPDYYLDINSLSHGAMTGRMLEEIEKILLREKPDYLLVYGDTNSTLAGALAAKKLHIKVIHVEAGLRSFDMKMPEEINRILTDQISDILFCPTQTAIDNLKNEGFSNKKNIHIINSGDIMFDSVLLFKQNMKKPKRNLPGTYILATVHRQENTDNTERLQKIIQAFNILSKKGIEVVLPLHPRTKKIINDNHIPVNFTLIDPVGYFEMMYLLEHAQAVITDSGGLQKEAYFFNKYCITLRDSTEWVELVENGFNTLIDFEKDISQQIESLLQRKVDNAGNLYGNGKTAKLIVNTLKELS
jgi:UDP-GlcNAc3NAcA epimerase